MDKTQEHIKMCEKAIEIQEQWIPDIGDVCSVIWDKNGHSCGVQQAIIQDRPSYGLSYNFTHDKDNDPSKFVLYNGLLFGKKVEEKLIDIKDFKKIIWQPRQDQIQEMCGDNWLKVMKDFWYFCSHPFDGEPRAFNISIESESPEQLWLSYYMGTKHHKIWDDEAEDWVRA